LLDQIRPQPGEQPFCENQIRVSIHRNRRAAPAPRHFATVDADGVALAAIQGLNRKLEEQSAADAKLKQQLVEIKEIICRKSK
jgi:hypothetical protein